ncbi:MAG TPA: TetR family transcriptional regulator [Acidimicrobiia bacterium]|jgi:AcrR family transcriptional regulator|nr:TetR family transcriptional regulator [Acidimicrobiia bacterium]
MARSGRRPGATDTRAAILTAAQAEFAAKGYDRATIRGIAAGAKVDPALVHHYFGTKEDLFAASIDLPIRPSELADTVMAEGVESAGRNITTIFFTTWENPVTRAPLLAMLRGAFDTRHGADVLREFFGTAMLGRVAGLIPGPEAEIRVALAVSHLIGVAVLRYVLGFPSLSDVPVARLIDEMSPKIQSYFA